jgi:hypothetical protein
MRKSEVFILVISTMVILFFVGFMFDYFLRTEEIQVIKKNLYYDSLLLEQDSVIFKQQKELDEKNKLIERLMLDGDRKLKNNINQNQIKIKELVDKLDSLNKQ